MGEDCFNNYSMYGIKLLYISCGFGDQSGVYSCKSYFISREILEMCDM